MLMVCPLPSNMPVKERSLVPMPSSGPRVMSAIRYTVFVLSLSSVATNSFSARQSSMVKILMGDFIPAGENQQKAITLYKDISSGLRVVAMFRLKDDAQQSRRLTDAVDTFSVKVLEGSGSRHISSVESEIDFDKYAGITDLKRIKRFWVSQALTPEVVLDGIKKSFFFTEKIKKC